MIILLERRDLSAQLIPVGDAVVTEDIRVGVDNATVDITVHHQVLDSQGDALSKQLDSNKGHKTERFIPFPFKNTLLAEVPVTDGHLLQ